MKRTRRQFSPEFKLESAELVVYQGYTVIDAAKAVGVGIIVRWNVFLEAINGMDARNWIRQLRSSKACDK